MAWQVVRPIDDIEALARGFVEGCIRIPPRFVWIFHGDEASRHHLSYSFNDLTEAYGVASYDHWSAHSLVGYGPQVWELAQAAKLDPRELDNIIRAGPNPYDGYSGLVRFFHGRPEPLTTQNSSSVFEVIAPLAVRFDVERITTTAEHVSVGLRARSRDFTRSVDLSWTAIGVDPVPLHGSVSLDDLAWSQEEEEVRSAVTLAPRANDLFLNVFIQDHEKCLDRRAIATRRGAGNERIAAHASSDPGLERFSAHLFPDDWKASPEFEQAVGTLLHFFGFQTNPLSSHKGAGAAVDHLAHDPLSDAIVAVECTVGALETGKLGKLKARAHALSSEVPDATVYAVLVSARPSGELSATELDKADDDGTVVLAREDLQGLWVAVERGATTADFIGELEGRRKDAAMRGHRKRTGPAV